MDGRSPGPAFSHERKECVIEETAARHGRESGRLCHREQVIVFMEYGICERHVRLIPGRTAPKQPSPRFEDCIPLDLEAIEKNFASLDPVTPDVFRRMAIFPGQVRRNAKPATPDIYLLAILVPAIFHFLLCVYVIGPSATVSF
jgi:hypothetical protein